MAKQGYIKLYRQIQDHWLWNKTPYDEAHAWIDLLLLANHEDTKAIINGKLQTFEKGTVNRSIKSLAERWGWSRKKTQNYIKALVDDQMLAKTGHTKGTNLLIVNYEAFQGFSSNKGSNKCSNDDSNTSQMGTQNRRTNNNDKNDKNDNNTRSRSHNTKPDIFQQALEHWQERVARGEIVIEDEDNID